MSGKCFVLVLLALLFGSASGQQSADGPLADPQPSGGRSRKVCVLGHVVKPSEVLIHRRLTVTQAIEAAGGIAGGKKGREVKVYSKMAYSEEARTIYVDLKAIEKRPYKNLELQPFDIVVVYSPNKVRTGTQPASNPCPSMLPESLWRGF